MGKISLVFWSMESQEKLLLRFTDPHKGQSLKIFFVTPVLTVDELILTHFSKGAV